MLKWLIYASIEKPVMVTCIYSNNWWNTCKKLFPVQPKGSEEGKTEKQGRLLQSFLLHANGIRMCWKWKLSTLRRLGKGVGGEVG